MTEQKETTTTDADVTAKPERRDLVRWDELASGESFAVIHDGEIIFGREERDRASWAEKIAAKALEGAKVDEGAQLQKGVPPIVGATAANDVSFENTPLSQLDHCLADLKSNHQKLAEYTEKSIRYLWQETKRVLARHDGELKDKRHTLDQLALQNRSLKTENKALVDRLDSDRPTNPF